MTFDVVDLARSAILDMGETAIGEYLGAEKVDDVATIHRFAATLTGYRGWQWCVVLAGPTRQTDEDLTTNVDALADDQITVSETALLPGDDALVAPEWVPWVDRIQPGDLNPGDIAAPKPNDERLVPGYVDSGDPEVTATAGEIGLGRRQVLSREGRSQAAERWISSEYGPASDMARSTRFTCVTCGFFIPLSGALRVNFGVCANAISADGRVVSSHYGCGAHSDATEPSGAGTPDFSPYDDGEVVVVAKRA